MFKSVTHAYADIARVQRVSRRPQMVIHSPEGYYVKQYSAFSKQAAEALGHVVLQIVN